MLRNVAFFIKKRNKMGDFGVIYVQNQTTKSNNKMNEQQFLDTLLRKITAIIDAHVPNKKSHLKSEIQLPKMSYNDYIEYTYFELDHIISRNFFGGEITQTYIEDRTYIYVWERDSDAFSIYLGSISFFEDKNPVFTLETEQLEIVVLKNIIANWRKSKK